MNIHAIHHRIGTEYCFPISKDRAVVRVRTAKNDFIKATIFYHFSYRFNRGDKTLYSGDMIKLASDELFDYYEYEIPLVENGLRYYFGFDDKLYYGAYSVYKERPQEFFQSFVLPYIAEQDIFTVPSWARDAVVYQIFPDRFHTGSPTLPENWYGPVTSESFLGGTLKGITSQLDYLEKLGINCIYMTPIFLSPTNHKYDTVDYLRIDPAFGTEDDLIELVTRSHAKNIRVILDAVFNHSSTEFLPFKDLVEKGEHSQYRNWFDIKKFPVEIKEFPDYATYGHHGNMPKLMTHNRETREYLISSAEYWTKTSGIDGWRIDVADEIEHDFWREFRTRIKAINPELLIVGEIWHDAAPWLDGSEYDTVMNYPFMASLHDLLINKSGSTRFFNRMNSIRINYRRAPWEILWNLIDSHDTPRFLTRASGSIKLQKLAALIQFTLRGAPYIYYGDELGMEGDCDPDCRRGMPWGEGDADVFEYYQKLIRVRKEYSVLRYGEMTNISPDEPTLVYKIEFENTQALVLVNLGEREIDYELKREYLDRIDGGAYSGSITIDPLEGRLLIAR